MIASNLQLLSKKEGDLLFKEIDELQKMIFTFSKKL